MTGVIHLADLELADQAGSHRGAATVYLIQQDAAGRVLDQSHQGYTLSLTPELYAKYLKSGILLQLSIRPRADLATLRVVVTGGQTSRAGSLIIPEAASAAR